MRVLPTFFTWKTEGALISYQSYLAKGSALQIQRKQKDQNTELNVNTKCKTQNAKERYIVVVKSDI